MQAHFLRYSCEIFTTKTCYVESKNIRLSIEKMRKMMLAMLRMRMCCCRINGGGSSNRLFTTGGFIIVPPSYTIIFPSTISPLSYSFSCSCLPFISSFISSFLSIFSLLIFFLISISSFRFYILSLIFPRLTHLHTTLYNSLYFLFYVLFLFHLFSLSFSPPFFLLILQFFHSFIFLLFLLFLHLLYFIQLFL